MVHETIEIIKILNKYFFGIGKNHTSINPDKLHLNPFISIGGNASIPGFVTTNPTPHSKGTEIANNKSRNGIKIIYFL